MIKIEKEIKIKWLSDFYNWKWIDPKNVDENFTTEDYVTINSSIQLVRIDPKVASENLWVANDINLFDNKENNGFLLYQCDSPSEIRKSIPLRFFYSKEYGKVFELKGSNTAFYEMFDFIFKNEKIKSDIIGEKDDDWKIWLQKNIKKYVRIFFDNVAGRHGRFEIIEAYKSKNKINKSYCLFLNRIRKYYELNPQEENNNEPDENFDFHKSILYNLNKKESFDAEHKVNSQQGEYLIWKECYMVFQNALFSADANVSISRPGLINLSNENQITAFDWYEDNEKQSEKLTAKLKEQYTIYPLSDKELAELNTNCKY